jgi:acyl dehydratase
MGVESKAMQVGYELPPVVKKITEDLLCNYSNRYPGVFMDTIHVSREAARGWGFPDLVLQGSQTMNFGAEVLFKVYREHWINNSNLTVKFTKPVFNGETVTAKGIVVNRKETTEGKICLTINVWAENTSGDKIMVGEAKVFI